MNKRIVILLLAALMLAAFALGAAGAVRLSDEEGDAAQEMGELIGVLVTTEPLDLFVADAYFADHAKDILAGGEISREDSASYEGRLYAALVDGNYVFSDVEGFACMGPEMVEDGREFSSFSSDAVFSDVKYAANVTDAGSTLTIEATIYACDDGDLRAAYMNPVYQESSGAVYAVSGQGMAMSGELVGSYTQTLRDTKTETAGDQTQAQSSSVEIRVSYVGRPTEITVTQFSDAGAPVRRESFTPADVPEAMTTEKDVTYLVVETRDVHGKMTRALYDGEDERFVTLCPREDGLCEQRSTALTWPVGEA